MKNLRFCIPLLLAALGLALGLATQASAQAKTVISKASDLPRRSITITGRASEVVEDMPRLLGYADTLIKNLEADLNRYEIQDRAALKSYYESLLGLYFFKDDYEKALSFIPQIQALCDKNAEKITIGLFLQAYAKAYAKEKNPSAETFQKEFAQQYAALWQALPYAEVSEEVESMKGRLSILNPALIGATLDTQIQTYLDNNKGLVPEGVAGTFINIRMARDRQIPLKDIMLKIFTDLYAANQSRVSKANIWTAREVNFTGQENYPPVAVFVWDSGVDMAVIPAQNHFRDAQGAADWATA
ncbi:MAG: hypothetical protein HC913_01390 [Microscillaceae bacterium]|nr:hypothetical protein [Microscillaceae bacterium]